MPHQKEFPSSLPPTVCFDNPILAEISCTEYHLFNIIIIYPTSVSLA